MLHLTNTSLPNITSLSLMRLVFVYRPKYQSRKRDLPPRYPTFKKVQCPQKILNSHETKFKQICVEIFYNGCGQVQERRKAETWRKSTATNVFGPTCFRTTKIRTYYGAFEFGLINYLIIFTLLDVASMRSYSDNSSRKIEYSRKVENKQKLMVANLPSMFLSIVDFYEHLWPIQSL